MFQEIVLIESDWNLKLLLVMTALMLIQRINRIRLEFKEVTRYVPRSFKFRINRIRLEFKDFCQ